MTRETTRQKKAFLKERLQFLFDDDDESIFKMFEHNKIITVYHHYYSRVIMNSKHSKAQMIRLCIIVLWLNYVHYGVTLNINVTWARKMILIDLRKPFYLLTLPNQQKDVVRQ